MFKKIIITILVITGIFIVGGLGGLFFDYVIFSKITTNPIWSQNPIIKALDNRVQVIKTTEKVIVADNESISDIASRASASVVYIDSFDKDDVRTSGSGVVLSSDGVIVTNTDVVSEKSVKQYIKLADGTVHDVKSVYIDDYRNLAFLRIEIENLSTISFSDSDNLRSGKRLIAISEEREAEKPSFILGGFVNTNYVFNIASPNSDFLQGVLDIDFNEYIMKQIVGSPVVDFHGDLVGLIASVNDKETKQNIYYAIAVNDISDAYDEFLQNMDVQNKTKYLKLGIDYEMITTLDAYVQEYHLTSGALVKTPQTYAEQSAFANTLAARSGLQGGDIIITVNNEVVDMQHNLSRLLRKYSKNGEEIVLTVLRGEDAVVITIPVQKDEMIDNL